MNPAESSAWPGSARTASRWRSSLTDHHSTAASSRLAPAEETEIGAALADDLKGTIQDDGTVLATKVEIKAKGVGGESAVSSLVAGTACQTKTLQFIVASVTVHTNLKTEYKGGVCTDIQVGVRVEVKGSHKADGVHATRVQIKK